MAKRGGWLKWLRTGRDVMLLDSMWPDVKAEAKATIDNFVDTVKETLFSLDKISSPTVMHFARIVRKILRRHRIKL